jgi:hypothetical protein
LRSAGTVTKLSAMSDDRREGPADPQDATPPGEHDRSASRDLAEGLELMLRAARKAVKSVDPGKLEALGRRAVQNLENLDRKRVGEFGRKAAKNLDPRRIEEIAEEAGRELLNVVERVAERVESAVAGTRSEAPPPGGDKPSSGGQPEQPGDGRPRVRVDDR